VNISDARELVERLRPRGVERFHPRYRDADLIERTARYGRARILLAKAEKLTQIIGDSLSADPAFEAALEELRAEAEKRRRHGS